MRSSAERSVGRIADARLSRDHRLLLGRRADSDDHREIVAYPLSLHDALPIYVVRASTWPGVVADPAQLSRRHLHHAAADLSPVQRQIAGTRRRIQIGRAHV